MKLSLCFVVALPLLLNSASLENEKRVIFKDFNLDVIAQHVLQHIGPNITVASCGTLCLQYIGASNAPAMCPPLCQRVMELHRQENAVNTTTSATATTTAV